MGILWFFLVFYLGLFLGFFLRAWLASRFKHYTGTMLVTHDEEKTVYTLVLDEYPEKLEFKKEVVFKVDAPRESLNRS
jgi:hypothetical protein